MARRTRGRFVRPSPRTKIWIGSGVGSTTQASAGSVLVSSLSAGALALRPFTILRTRVVIQYESDQTGASERAQGTYGKIVVTEAASAVGVTAIPNPSGIDGDPDSDWFVWQAMQNSFQFISGVGVHAGNAVNREYVIDSKAMRKVGADDDIATVFDQQTSNGSILFTNGRMLIQLH